MHKAAPPADLMKCILAAGCWFLFEEDGKPKVIKRFYRKKAKFSPEENHMEIVQEKASLEGNDIPAATRMELVSAWHEWIGWKKANTAGKLL